MAKVILKEKREMEAGYHIYRQPSPAGDLITVRRKVAMPSDVYHNSSKPTQRQRNIFSRASKRWAAIPAPVKADMSNNYAWVPVQGHFAKADYKVLRGQQLFISQEIHQQQYHQAHQKLPLWLCIVLTDEQGRALDLKGRLSYWFWIRWYPCLSFYLSPGNTLFYPVREEQSEYKFGFTDYGIYGQYIFSYPWPDIKNLRYQKIYPAIFEQSLCPYGNPTYAPRENWDLIPSTDPAVLWRYEPHEHDGTGWHNYFPYPMARFTVRKLTNETMSIRLTPYYFHWNNCFSSNLAGTGNVFWQIRVTRPGICTIEPTQRTIIYNFMTQEIIGYQD